MAKVPDFDSLPHSRGRGRPYTVAVLPFSNARKVAFLDEFYAAIAGFRYAECAALARALNMNPGSIYQWKYRQKVPRWDTAIDVIEWVKAGKRVRKVYQPKAPQSKVM